MTDREPNEIQKSTNVPAHIGDTEHRLNEILGGRYRVISFLGRGGMGVVYKVEQIFLGKELALKTIDQASQSDNAIRRFQAEARAVFAVNHPNIVSVHDFGLLDDQTPFLAMEFVQGRTIGELIQTRALPLEDALKIFIQVCFGLAHAHKNGVVHRDIKPNNIMVLDDMEVGTEGSVKILDFGIAKLTQHDGGEIQALTKTGEIFGSPIYMSPEQCTGEKIDHRCDIYSLGCVIFEVLTGTPPFVGESALSTMMMHQTSPAPTLKEASLGTNFSPELERLVHTMLAKNPNERYQDLGIAAHDLAAIKSGQLANFSISAKPTRSLKTQAVSTISMKREHFILWIASVAIVSTFSTFLIMQLCFSGEKPVVPPTQSTVVDPQTTPDVSDAFKEQVESKDTNIAAEFVGDADLKHLKDYKDAQSVELQVKRPDELTDEGLSYLTSSKLLKLKLYGQIEKADNFSQLEHLSELDLSRSPVSDSALSNIAKLKMLSALNLENCRVLSENGIRKLIPSTSLSSITLTKDKYSPSLISYMHEKMPQCTIANYDSYSPLDTKKMQSKERDEYKKNLVAYEQIKAINPSATANAEYLKNMSIVRSGQHRYSEARKLLDQAIQILNNNHNDNALPEFLNCAAEAATADHADREAVKYADRLMDILPATMMHNDPKLYHMFKSAVQYPARLNDWQKVIRYCAVAIPLAERFSDAASKKDRFELYSQAGDSNLHLNNKSEALQNYKKLAQRSDTGRDKDFYWHAAALVQMGKCLPTDEEQKKSYLEGIKLIEDKGMPDTFNILERYCDACVNVGVILLKEGNWKDAIEYNKKGLVTAETRMTAPIHLDAKARQQAHVLAIINILKRHGGIEEARAMARKYHFDMEL